MFIGVVTRGKYGRRLLATVAKYTDHIISSTSISQDIPDFIDDPVSYIDGLGIDESILSSDLIITFSLHPDITPEIILRAARSGSKAVIVPGGASLAGDPDLLKQISETYDIMILIEDICCEIGDDINNTINEFTSRMGRPKLKVQITDGKISDVTVIRGAPCGSTWWMAERLIGVLADEAPARAGLLIQQYPCRAVRGTRGGIHRSAQLHKEALVQAINSAVDYQGN
jgi:hypothetical protein